MRRVVHDISIGAPQAVYSIVARIAIDYFVSPLSMLGIHALKASPGSLAPVPYVPFVITAPVLSAHLQVLAASLSPLPPFDRVWVLQ